MFVIGFDTYARIIDPKYYPNGDVQTEMFWFKERNVKFVVGSRNGVNCPRETYESLFIFLEEEEFNCDISSTKLREIGQGL